MGFCLFEANEIYSLQNNGQNPLMTSVTHHPGKTKLTLIERHLTWVGKSSTKFAYGLVCKRICFYTLHVEFQIHANPL